MMSRSSPSSATVPAVAFREAAQRDARASGVGHARALSQAGEEKVERHRDDGDGAEEDLLDVRSRRQQREADLQLGQQQRTAERADDRSLAVR